MLLAAGISLTRQSGVSQVVYEMASVVYRYRRACASACVRACVCARVCARARVLQGEEEGTRAVQTGRPCPRPSRCSVQRDAPPYRATTRSIAGPETAFTSRSLSRASLAEVTS